MTDEKSADDKAPAAGVEKDAAGVEKDAAGVEKDAAGVEKKDADSAAADGAAADSAAAEQNAANEAAADTTTAEGNEAEDAAENDAPEKAEPLDLAGQLAAAIETIDALKDRALRGQAETENVRRRAARDVENAHRYALEKFTGKLLPVLDSLEKAIEAGAIGDSAADVVGNADADTGVCPPDTALIEGVELSLKLFLGVLSQAGINQLDPLGEPFDPQYHEAMAILENPAAEPNSVLEVMQKGYALNGRLVRAAKVVVSKAPVSSAASEDGSESG